MNESTWKRIESALDRRIDPFDDPQTLEALEKDPAGLVEASYLVERLSLLQDLAGQDLALSDRPDRQSEGSSQQTTARKPRRAAMIFATLLAASVLLMGYLYTQPAPASTPEYIAAPNTVSLVVETYTPPAYRAARVVLNPIRIVGWTLEGESQ